MRAHRAHSTVAQLVSDILSFPNKIVNPNKRSLVLPGPQGRTGQRRLGGLDFGNCLQASCRFPPILTTHLLVCFCGPPAASAAGKKALVSPGRPSARFGPSLSGKDL